MSPAPTPRACALCRTRAALTALLEAVLAARGAEGPPVFLKVAPDLEPADIDDIAQIGLDMQLGGLIVCQHHDFTPAPALGHMLAKRAACRVRRCAISHSSAYAISAWPLAGRCR